MQLEPASAPRAPRSSPEALVRAFGDGDLIACAALQDGVEWFETSYGAIPYRSAWGYDVTLGGPLADPSDHAALIAAFLRARNEPVFCYVRERTARLLADTELHVAGMGVDRHVDVDALLTAPPKEVSGALKHARRGALTLDEVDLARLDDAARDHLRSINADYLARAECTVEMSFLNRPLDLRPDGLRRTFVLRERGAVLGVAVLNPIFERGAVTAYLLDLLRFARTKIWGVWLSTVHALAARLHAEGVGLSLGFAPLHRVRHPRHASRALSAQVDLGVRLLSTTPYLERLRWLKDRVPGADEPRFFASSSRSALTNLFLLMEVSGVGWRYLLGPDLLRVLARGVRGA